MEQARDSEPPAMPPAAASGPGRGSLLVVFLTVFIDLLGFGMVLPLLPIYAKEFTHDESGWTIGILMSSFSAMQFVCSPLWGRLSDRVGRRPVLMAGLAGSVLFYALFGIATVMRSLFWLFVSRIGAGVTGATIATAQAYIADSTPPKERAKGMAIIGAAFGLGFTFGPLFGLLALPGEGDRPGPGPGFAAAGLSAVALALAVFKLPESWRPSLASAQRRLLDLGSLRDALAVPSVGVLLVTLFVCVFSFANFESTLSLLVKDPAGTFHFDYSQVSLTFAYVGLSSAVAQGFVVRRLSKYLSEGLMAGLGAVAEVAGFVLLAGAAGGGSIGRLLTALTIVVFGFAFLNPSLQALLSRRTDPAKQGGVLGLGQSMAALARIAGPVVGIRLFHLDAAEPLLLAAALMAASLFLVILAARSGKDFPGANDA